VNTEAKDSCANCQTGLNGPSKSPYLWERHGFWIVVIIFAMIAVNLLIRIRETSLRNREKQLKSEVATKTAELERLAKRDALTDLYNRRAFDEILKREFRKALHQKVPVCLAILDIDHFKQINDTYLHSTGDKVLEHLAEVLKGAVRKADQVARWGGEEFVLFLPHTTLTEASELCERVRKQVEKARFSDVDPNLRLTVSIGVAQASDVDTHSTLLIKADKALYQAKDMGRNKVCVNKG